jgi:hypothetical protein
MIDQVSRAPEKKRSFSDLEGNLGITEEKLKTLTNRNHMDGLLTVQNNEVKMSESINLNMLDFYQQMVQKSVRYQMMVKLLESPNITFTDLSRDLAISEDNCSFHINQLNLFLEDYDCHISFLQKKRLQGKEHQIRFLYYNLFEGLDLDKLIGNSPSLDAVTERLVAFMPDLTYTVLSKLRLHFYIFQNATQNGYFIRSEDDFIVQDSPYIKYDDFFDKLDAIDFLKTCPDLQTKQKECRYLYFLFCHANLMTLEACQSLETQLFFSKSSSVRYFIEQFQEKTKLVLKEDELNYLHYNLSLLNQEAAVFCGGNETFGLKELTTIFDHTKTNISGFIRQFLQDICEHHQTIGALIQNSPTLYHHYAILLRTVIERHAQPVKVLVQTNYSVLYREILVSRIMNATPFPIEVYTSEQLNGEKIDGVISDWFPEKKYENIPFFSVSSFYTDWQPAELKHFISCLSDKKNPLPRISDTKCEAL